MADIEENSSKGKKVRTHCNKCRKDVNHEILMNYYQNGTAVLGSDFDMRYGKVDYTADYFNDYQIIKCLGCDSISFRSYNYFSEIQNEIDDGTWEERYPESAERTEKDFKYLPSTLIEIYEEVVMAYNKKGSILCAAGIRAILEGICKDKGITDDNLDKKIQEMCKQGFIAKQHESILHKLRFLGNEVLHELQKPTQEEISAALDIIEHVIESLYEIERKAKHLRKNKP